MKKIALIAFITGVLMAALAYFAEMNDWQGLPEYLTVGFIGYILIISAAAWYLSSLLYSWLQEMDPWKG